MPAICSRVHCKHILWGKVQGDEGRTGLNLVLNVSFYEAFVVGLPERATKHGSIGYSFPLGGA